MKTKVTSKDLDLAVEYIKEHILDAWITVEVDESTENLIFRFEDGERMTAEIEVHPAQQK